MLTGVLPGLKVDLPPEGERRDPRGFFAVPPADVWLEIGFGNGEHLVAHAVARPDIGIIGCEPFLNGVTACLKQVTDAGLTNVRVMADDARFVLEALAEASLGRVFILHPDPWPKARHHKRRIVSPPILADLARVMRPGAELRLATDHADYAEWMQAEMTATPDFTVTAQWRTPERPEVHDWPASRYEQKALAQGIPCLYIKAVRRG